MTKKICIRNKDEDLLTRIFTIRGRKVMLDSDLAELYGVPTKRLNEQVKRKLKRFPPDFMFQLNGMEKSILTENHDRLKKLKFSSSLPFAFTEHGAVMLASVMNSDRAIRVNVRIVRSFVRMRRSVFTYHDLRTQLQKLERTTVMHDECIAVIFGYLNELLDPYGNETKRIGFRQGGAGEA